MRWGRNEFIVRERWHVKVLISEMSAGDGVRVVVDETLLSLLTEVYS